MNRESVERELREKLAPLIAEDSFSYVVATPGECVAALLPWVMEIIEAARADERIDLGELP